MSRLKILIKTHPFTCASYNPLESLHIDHIGPITPDEKDILVMIDAFSRWVVLFPTKTTGASEATSCVFQHFGRFETPNAFRNELFSELARLSAVEHSFAAAYSKEENGIKKSCATYVPCFLMHACTISGHSSSCPWYNVL